MVIHKWENNDIQVISIKYPFNKFPQIFQKFLLDEDENIIG